MEKFTFRAFEKEPSLFQQTDVKPVRINRQTFDYVQLVSGQNDGPCSVLERMSRFNS